MQACITCGRALAWRRARQGIRQHPGCRRRLRTPPVDQALTQTAEVLERLGTEAEDEELAGLFREAAACAGTLVKDLEQLRRAPPPPRD